jgi:hypothetical protein
MGRSWPAWIWRWVLIASFAVMALLVIFSLWAFLQILNSDMFFDVARDRSLEPVVPMGALTLTPDGARCQPGEVAVPGEAGCVQDYVPLLGYLWWFGPLGLVFVFAMCLAIVYYSGQRLRPAERLRERRGPTHG